MGPDKQSRSTSTAISRRPERDMVDGKELMKLDTHETCSTKVEVLAGDSFCAPPFKKEATSGRTNIVRRTRFASLKMMINY